MRKYSYLCNYTDYNSVRIKEIIEVIEHFAPLTLQENYDNAGLQAGLAETEAAKALLCIDVTEQVIEEAAQSGANLVVAHHPLLFRPLRCVSDRDIAQRCIRMAVKNDIAIYAAHTNLDNARGGVNFKIAEKLGLEAADFLQPNTYGGGSGVIGAFAEPMEAEPFLAHVKSTFGAECLMHNEPLQRAVKTVALCGGAGGFLLETAVAQGADAFITGEMHYHAYFGHEQEIQIAVTGHYQSERFTVELLQTLLAENCKTLETVIATTDTNPIKYL